MNMSKLRFCYSPISYHGDAFCAHGGPSTFVSIRKQPVSIFKKPEVHMYYPFFVEHERVMQNTLNRVAIMFPWHP